MLEQAHAAYDLYLWLSMRHPAAFPERELAQAPGKPAPPPSSSVCSSRRRRRGWIISASGTRGEREGTTLGTWIRRG